MICPRLCGRLTRFRMEIAVAVVKRKRQPTEFGLILDKVRCFAHKQVIPIRPLTLLVGENSSGKSTVLAATSVVLSYGFPVRTSFNAP